MVGQAAALVFGVILKIWKPIFFIVGFALIIGLICMWIGLIIGLLFSMPFASFIFGSTFLSYLAITNIFFVFAIPVSWVVLFISRLLFKKRMSQNWRIGLVGLWIVNVVSCFAIGSYMARDFNQGETFLQSEQTMSFAPDTVYLNLGKSINANSLIDFGDAKISDGNLVIRDVQIQLEKSTDEHFKMTKSHFSRGKNSWEVKRFAEAMEYEPVISDNNITFPREFVIPKGSKWRGQTVLITLEIPEGKTVKFGSNKENFGNYMHHSNWDNPPVRYYRAHTWTMKDGTFYSKEEALLEKGNDRGFKDFQKIVIRGGVKVNIEKGEKFEVKAMGRKNQLERVEMEQVGETLDIHADGHNFRSPVRIHIKAPDLKIVDLEDTDDVNIKGFDGEKLDIINEGHHEVKVFVDVDSLYLNFKQNKSDIRGKGKFLKVKLDDRARMDAEHYTATNAVVKAHSARKIRLEVVDTLRHDLSGNSSIDFDEQPKVIIDMKKERERAKEEAAKKEELVNKESSIDEQH